MRRVAFLINFEYKKWLGGFYLIKNLIICINKFSKNKIEPVLIVKKNLNKNELKEFKNFKLIKTNFFFGQSKWFKIFNKIKVICFGKSNVYENFFKVNKIDVLSHINVFSNNIILGNKSSVKTLSLAADFQHLYYPENFPLKQRILRNFNTYLSSKFSSKILLISNDAKKDLKKISLSGYNNSVVNKFIFFPPKKNNIIKLAKLKKKYKFQSNYFFLPNQYWKHKNHIVVLKALNLLSKTKKKNNILVLSSGSSDDQKEFGIFNKIKKFININNLNTNYKYLGIVPYNDLISLMYHSIAIINPSKFEGRSSTVEQAKSLGKKVILSNINIHKEQNPDRGIYFNEDDNKKLADILMNEYKKFSSSKEKKIINNTYLKSNKNLFNYYLEYEKIVDDLF